MSKKDISKKTVAVLLIVAVAFSIICTWAIMSKAQDIINIPQEKGSSAKISLTIEDNAPPKIPSGEGKISLIIAPKGG